MIKVKAVANSIIQQAHQIEDIERKEPEPKQNLHGMASVQDSFERYDPSSIRSQLNEYNQGDLKNRKSSDSIERNDQSRLGERRYPEGSQEQRKAEEEQKAMIEATMEGIRKSEEEREHAEMKRGVSKDFNDQHKSRLGEQRYPEHQRNAEEGVNAERRIRDSKDSNDQHKSRLGEQRYPEHQRNAEEGMNAERTIRDSKDFNDQHESRLGEHRYPEGSQEQRKAEEEQKAVLERIRKSEEEREHAEMKSGVSKGSNDQHESQLGEQRSPEQQRNAEKDEKGKK